MPKVQMLLRRSLWAIKKEKAFLGVLRKNCEIFSLFRLKVNEFLCARACPSVAGML